MFKQLSLFILASFMFFNCGKKSKYEPKIYLLGGASSEQIIYQSKDYGQSFKSLLANQSINNSLSAHIDQSNIYISQLNTGIKISKDSGQQFTEQPLIIDSNTYTDLFSITANKNTLYVGGSNVIYVSYDQGQSFEQKGLAVSENNAVVGKMKIIGNALYSILWNGNLTRSDLDVENSEHFTSPELGFVVDIVKGPGNTILLGSDSGIHQSNDGGLTYTKISDEYSAHMAVEDENVYIDNNKILKKSNDGAVTFVSILDLSTTYEFIRDFKIFDNTIVLLTNTHPSGPLKLYISKNDGQDFSEKKLDEAEFGDDIQQVFIQ